MLIDKKAVFWNLDSFLSTDMTRRRDSEVLLVSIYQVADPLISILQGLCLNKWIKSPFNFQHFESSNDFRLHSLHFTNFLKLFTICFDLRATVNFTSNGTFTIKITQPIVYTLYSRCAYSKVCIINIFLDFQCFLYRIKSNVSPKPSLFGMQDT